MKSAGKPKELLHKATGGILNFFQQGVNAGKRVIRTTSDSIDGKRMASAKGSILVSNELLALAQALEAKEKRPQQGGAKEIARRLRQLQRNQNASSI